MDPYLAPEHHRAALITIDVQRDTLDGQPFEIPGTSAAVPNILRLAEYFRRESQPIVHVVRLYQPDGSNVDLCRRRAVELGARLVLVGSPGSQLAEPLLPSPDVVLETTVLLSGKLQPVGARE